MSAYIDIFCYTKFRRYLKEYQERRQEAEPAFSKTEFCNLLGLPNTRSYFNDVIQGKRVTATMESRFIHVIGLKSNEAKYFSAMIAFDQAKTQTAREIALASMMNLNKTPQTIMDPEGFEFFGNWYNSTIYAILEVLNVSDDLEAISQKIFPPVSVKKIRGSLDLMIKMNLIRKNEKGFYKPVKESLSSVQQSRNQMVLQYQKQCLELSREALDSKGEESRDMTTFTFAVSKKAQKKVENAAEKFKKVVRQIVTMDKEDPEVVEHINLHLFSNIR